jgi:LacI family transcriptional regulator
MNDVAELAGVSRTTVSLVLNGRGQRFGEETRRRVEEAARKLNFRPSIVAQQLRTSRSRIIGLITDEIATGPFAGGLIAGAQAAARKRDHTLVVMNTGQEGDLAVEFEALEDRGVDALIFATVMTRRVAIARQLRVRSVILLNCLDEENAFPTILPNDRAGGAAAAELVAAQGHTRIALIGGERGTWPASERLAGYRVALRVRGLRVERGLVQFGNWHADSGYELARRVLTSANPPTALLFGNDRMALGGYDAIKELGLRIPEDVSVVGYDDQEEIVRYTRPPMTTMRIPYYEMGEAAVEEIFDGQAHKTISLECKPVVRASVGPAPVSNRR